MEKQSLITRVGYCDRCAKNHSPHDEQLMLLRGAHGFHVDVAHPKRIPAHPFGFTPHLYSYEKREGDIIIAHTICCINGCDVTLTRKQDNSYEFRILETKWKEVRILVNDWNALQKYKRDNDYII